MSQPSHVEVFFPEQPFGGVQVQFPEELRQISINTGSPVNSVFGRIGDVVAECPDYESCYAPIGSGLPGGGLQGQVLTKQSDSPLDTFWNTPTGGGGGSINAAPYRFSTSTGGSDPGNGKLRFNNATPGSVTAIYIDSLTDESVDISAYLGLLEAGDIIAVQDKDDSSNAFRFNISGTLTNNTGWWTIPVTYEAHQGSLPSNNAQIVAVVQMEVPSGDFVLKQVAYPTPTTLNQVIQCLKDAGLCAP